MLTVGEKIKYFRMHRNMTQQQLAYETGIHPVSIRKYETNKMQPQAAQIERIATVLGISRNAIDSELLTTVRTESIGDWMALLMQWHKSGILTFVGERDGDLALVKDTVRLIPHPFFGKAFSCLLREGQNEKAIRPDDLQLTVSKETLLDDLLCWESAYFRYSEMKAHYGDSQDPAIQNALTEMGNNLEKIEMQLQLSHAKLIFRDE